jgi:hypothetical protein
MPSSASPSAPFAAVPAADHIVGPPRRETAPAGARNVATERVRVLVLGNGVTSAERQCYGLLRALWPAAGVSRPDAPCVVEAQDAGLASVHFVRVAWPNSPAAALLRALPAAAHLLAGALAAGVDVAALAAEADAAAAQGTLTLLVACGRDTVPAAAAVRAAAPRAVVAVQLLHPRVRLSAFDLCLVPAHDFPSGAPPPEAGRAHLTHGALHDLDAAALAAARAQWAPTVGAAARPLVVCLVGGPTKHVAFDCDAVTRQLAAVAAAAQRAGGSTRCVRPPAPHILLLSHAFNSQALSLAPHASAPRVRAALCDAGRARLRGAGALRGCRAQPVRRAAGLGARAHRHRRQRQHGHRGARHGASCVRRCSARARCADVRSCRRRASTWSAVRTRAARRRASWPPRWRAARRSG